MQQACAGVGGIIGTRTSPGLLPFYAAVCRIVRHLQGYSFRRRSAAFSPSSLRRGHRRQSTRPRADWTRFWMADTAHPHVTDPHDGTRRDFLLLSAAAMGGVGAAIAIWPFIDSMNPARDTLALSTTEVDLTPVQVGQRL